MRFIVDRDTFKRAMSAVAPFATKEGYTSSVAINVQPGGSSVRCMNTESGATAVFDCNCEIAGSCALSAADLLAAVKSLPNPTVTVSVDDRAATIESGAARFRLYVIADNVTPPPMPEPEGATFTSKADDMAACAASVVPCTAKDSNTYGINGVHLERTSDGLRCVATDRHRLALYDIPGDGDVSVSKQLAPASAMVALAKLPKGGNVVLTTGDGAVWASFGDVVQWYRLLDGEFPDYKAVIPHEFATVATVDAGALRASLLRVEPLAKSTAHVARIEVDNDTVTVSARNVDKGEGSDAVGCELDGPTITFGANPSYLADALSRHDGPVELAINHPLSPLVVRPPGGEVTHVIMPMRLD